MPPETPSGVEGQTFDDSLLIHPATLTNRASLDIGVLDRSAATIRVDAPLENQGLLDNRGTLLVDSELSNTAEVRSRGQIEIGAGATVNPGNSPGTLTPAGDLILNGVIEIGAADHDRLIVDGALTFGAGARVRDAFVDGFVPAAGQHFAFADLVIASASAMDGMDGVTFVVDGLPKGRAAAWSGGDLTVTAVPEPGTAALWLADLGWLGCPLRRRRA